jgi:hypothetical protein
MPSETAQKQSQWLLSSYTKLDLAVWSGRKGAMEALELFEELINWVESIAEVSRLTFDVAGPKCRTRARLPTNSFLRRQGITD